MKKEVQPLETVDRVEIITLVDNYVDVLLPDAPGVKRPPLAKQGEIPATPSGGTRPVPPGNRAQRRSKPFGHAGYGL